MAGRATGQAFEARYPGIAAAVGAELSRAQGQGHSRTVPAAAGADPAGYPGYAPASSSPSPVAEVAPSDALFADGLEHAVYHGGPGDSREDAERAAYASTGWQPGTQLRHDSADYSAAPSVPEYDARRQQDYMNQLANQQEATAPVYAPAAYGSPDDPYEQYARSQRPAIAELPADDPEARIAAARRQIDGEAA